MKSLESRIREYLLEANQEEQEHCYASYHEEAISIIKDYQAILIVMQILHSWCQGNIESKGCAEIKPFCIQVRNLIETTGIIK